MRTIGIIAALSQELDPLIRCLENARSETFGPIVIHHGEVSGRPVSLAISGEGKKAAERGAAALIESCRPSLIVSTGFAGGLTEEAAAGTIVCGGDLVDETNARETFDVPDGPALLAGGVRGVIITTRHFVSAVDHRRLLRDRFGAVAVDMESIHIGRIAREAGIPFIVARIISDDLTADLPDMRSVMNRNGSVAVVRAVLYFVRHPGTLVAFIRFVANLNAHARTLNGYLRRLIAALPDGG
jgi:adenosylhomocysteine nucleosidase